MGKELEAIGNWGNQIVLGFRYERLEGLEVLSFWSDSGAKQRLGVYDIVNVNTLPFRNNLVLITVGGNLG
jgi:hypothetical protein